MAAIFAVALGIDPSYKECVRLPATVRTCASGQMQCEADPFFAVKIRTEPAPVAVDQLPGELQESMPLHFARNSHWFRPTRLAEAQELKHRLSDATTRSQVRFRRGQYGPRDFIQPKPAHYFIDLSAIAELQVAEISGNSLPLAQRRRSSGCLNWHKQLTSGRPPKPWVAPLVWHGQWVAGIQVPMPAASAGIFSSSKAIRDKARLSPPIC